MRALLRFEEFGQFLLCGVALYVLDAGWWKYPALILLPDISMVGYLAGPKWGARLYNFAHHKALGVALLLVGYLASFPLMMVFGFVWYGHSAMDRMFGYGLKFEDSFHHTHLGNIGKHKE
jgi:hypothetical protein